MSLYGQYCPVSKAVEVLGERWTLLLIRELLLGSTRFNELQRGLAKMSPSLLTKRLKELEQSGLLFKTKISGQKGYEYHLTPAGKELMPLVMELVRWGMKWVSDKLSEEDTDVEFLMWDLHRNIKVEHIPQERVVIKFHFSELEKFKDWWIIVNGAQVDLCTDKPADEADLYINSSVLDLSMIWLNQISWSQAQRENRIEIIGNRFLQKEISNWLGASIAAKMQSHLATAN